MVDEKLGLGLGLGLGGWEIEVEVHSKAHRARLHFLPHHEALFSISRWCEELEHASLTDMTTPSLWAILLHFPPDASMRPVHEHASLVIRRAAKRNTHIYVV